MANQVSLIRTLSEIAALWIASDVGYYIVLPLFGFSAGYSNAPVGIALYYAFWVAVSVNTFWPIFKKWRPIVNVPRAYMFLLASFAGLVLFALFVMPKLPSIVWTESWDPPELMVANHWYFLPKAIEILLQQVLIAALVLAFSARGYSIRAISLWSMILFGGAHLALSFGGLPFGYVTRFIISAMAFGLIFPRLMLKAPNGFTISYTLHWLYYVVTVVMAHTISPYIV
ncbi:MAG: hypothetical protein Q7R73_00395 [bacterium]|nr:hypothetical protein [bacterium]